MDMGFYMDDFVKTTSYKVYYKSIAVAFNE